MNERIEAYLKARGLSFFANSERRQVKRALKETERHACLLQLRAMSTWEALTPADREELERMEKPCA